ncbi:family 16 glycosylhydrolase [Actinoplanes derwentensis]|uniref:Glycosyl hydrolases family 16 n=1 Tax=Actinoplanes derwentensis TaxID=113562 RepID=A0A1H2D2V4_9ACTN|nr:family 16 glycosylhydrolase [Actinoplanes derwentensis]SDT76914.1 Glycosyl hydrolases family 16 [Actinoplanes derwentensis]
MNWGRAVAAIVTTTLAVTVTCGAAASATTVDRVVLDDDFAGERGTAPATAVWSEAKAWQDGSGRLVLGSMLRTRKTFGQAYGRVEARVLMNRAGEPWRAIGMVDGDGRSLAGTVDVLDASPVGGGDFHTYTIDWNPTTITWMIDGRPVQRFTPAAKVPYSVALGLGTGDRRSSGMLVDRVTVTVRVTVAPDSAPAWRAFTAYTPGQFVEYDDVIYQVRERHTSLPGWQPTLVPELFKKF